MASKHIIKPIFSIPFILLVSLIIGTDSYAKTRIYFEVIDSVTRMTPDSVTVSLINADKEVVDSYFRAEAPTLIQDGRLRKVSAWFPLVAKKPGDYSISVESPHYSSKYFPVKIDSKEDELHLKTVLLNKMTYLDEVKVVASKVKMVIRGDTLVYNADAFNLAEGSMLDRLLEQLPGVSLNDMGQITVNGQYVSSLLINGKNFFSGDPKVALQNLPAYTVNKVKVYRKEEGDAYLRNRTEAERKKDPLVIDVNLKKKFLGSYMGNTDFAGGTDNRYSMRAFLAGFDRNTNFGLFGNINNVGMDNNPIQGGDIWDSSSQKGADDIYRKVGLSLNYQNQKGTNGSLSISGSSNDYNVRTITNSINYLPDDYNYTARSATSSRNSSTGLGIEGSLGLSFSKVYSISRIYGSIGRGNGNSRGTSKSHKGDSFLDSLTNDDGRFINSFSSVSRANSTNHYLQGTQSFSVSMPYNSDILGVNANIYTIGQKSENWLASNNISLNGRSILNDFTNTPSRNTSISSSLSYSHRLSKKIHLSGSYDINLTDRHNSRVLSHFLPDSIMTELPVVTDTLTLISDIRQSFSASSNTLTNTISLRTSFNLNTVSLSIYLPYSLRTDRMRDTRANSIIRHSRYLSPALSVDWKHLRASTSVSTSTPQAEQLLDFTDDSNLMSIRKGNPNLRNTVTYSANASFSRIFSSHPVMNYSVETGFTEQRNAIANAVSFNPDNGVNTISAFNVDGNRRLWGKLAYGQNFGKRKNIRIEAKFDANHNRSVAFASTGTPQFLRSVVNSTELKPLTGIRYYGDKINIGTQIFLNSLHISGNLDSFVTSNLVTGGCSLSGWLKLPLGFQIDSSWVYSIESGYADPSMNRKRLFWKASVQKMFGRHNEWSARIDGYDILGQVSNLSRSVNAQGITETWKNQLGRYVLLHLQYKFNFPKKK